MLFKKLIRTAGIYKAQFISMIIMTALGIGMFLGFNMEWVSLENNMFSFFEETGFADYRIYSEEGFTEEELEKIRQMEGIDTAARYVSVNADLEGTSKVLAITVTEDPEVSGFVLMEGEEYDESSTDGMWLFDKFAKENGINVEDSLTLSYESIVLQGTVKGLIESSEYLICLQDETQLMPDFGMYGYVYIAPAMLEHAVSDTVREEILEYAEKTLGILYTDKMGELMVNSTFDAAKDKAMNQVYPQINVLSDMDAPDFKDAVNEALGRTMVILTKDENVSYAEAMGEANEGKTMGLILPVLFLLISVLTMVTTMHRIASNEKTQIGTLKALGFKDRRIIRHYSCYTLLIALAGTVLGIALGYFVAWFIMNPNGMMGTYLVMPSWKLFSPWWCWAAMALVILLMVLIGRISVKNMMKGPAADALRPYVPKVSRPMLVEKTRLWERLGFGTRWNIRDIMRHKSRSLVTLIGILGCMVLMVAAIGMYETAGAFIKMTYSDNAGYSSRIFVASGTPASQDRYRSSVDNTAALELASEYDADYVASLSIQIQDETYGMEIYHLEHDLVHFTDENGNILELPSDGALASLRIRDKYHLKVGDEVTCSLFGTDARFTVRISGFNRSMSESITLSDTYARTLEYDGFPLTDSGYYRIGAVFTAIPKTQIPSDSRISSVQSKDDIANSMDQFMEILYTAVIILVFAAIVLGIVVLYNLGIMSYTERYREMATLKVVGFRNNRIRKLLVSQNLWITVVGIVLGIFAGIGVLEYLMKALAPEYEMKVVIGPLTIIVSVAVTFAVSMLVGLMVSRKSRKIDMVVALKMPE